MFKILEISTEIGGSVWELTFLHSQIREEQSKRERDRDRDIETETERHSLTELRKDLNIRFVLINLSNSLESNRLQLYFKSMISQPGIHVTCRKSNAILKQENMVHMGNGVGDYKR